MELDTVLCLTVVGRSGFLMLTDRPFTTLKVFVNLDVVQKHQGSLLTECQFLSGLSFSPQLLFL